MEFVDFTKVLKRGRINLLFPGWKKGERVAFFSPHDDDAVLGAGYMILAAVRSGGIPAVVIFCRGDAGYSTPAEKRGIVNTRKEEAVRSYATLGARQEDVHFFNIPDFSLMSSLDRRPPWGKGVFDKIVAFLRREAISRLVFSSGHLEHWDHTAVFYTGIYTAPQAQDPILADLGPPHLVKTYLTYSVWGDFEPASEVRATPADLGILAAPADEERVIAAINGFSSQARVIRNIVAHRRRRRTDGGYLELYRSVQIRRPIDYSPYFDRLRKM